MRAILEQPRPRTSDAEDLRLSADWKASAREIAQAPSDASLPPDALKAQMQSMLDPAVQGRDAFRKANEQIDVIVDHRKPREDPRKRNPRDTLARIRREEAEKEAADIAPSRRRRPERSDQATRPAA